MHANDQAAITVVACGPRRDRIGSTQAPQPARPRRAGGSPRPRRDVDRWSASAVSSATAWRALRLAIVLAAATSAHAAGWELTFADEFDGTALDATKWNPGYVWSPDDINHELQCYTPDAFEFATSTLRIRGDTRRLNGKAFTSGAITSFGRFAQRFGYFAMRARLPAGNGLWPAFWLLPRNLGDASGGEIDIVEQLGQQPDTVYMTTHGPGGSQTVCRDPALADGGYHVFALQWTPTTLAWYIDGSERARRTEHIPNEPYYVLANLAIGGDWPVPPDATTPFPSHLDIDWIRVYRQAAAGISLPGPGEGAVFDAPDPAPRAGVVLERFSAPSRIERADAATITASLSTGAAALTDCRFGLRIFDAQGHGLEGPTVAATLPASSTSELTWRYTAPADLAPGWYRIAIGAWTADGSQNLFWVNNVAWFLVPERSTKPAPPAAEAPPDAAK